MPKEQDILKAYIFGETGEDERSAIELRLMTDDDFFHELSLVEEIVIQDYADGNLTESERDRFERCLFVSEENRRKAKFARALRKYINENEPDEKTADEKTSIFDSLKSFFISPIPATLALLIVLSLGGFWIWKSYNSDNSEVLLALNKAYETERPLQSRITGLKYASFNDTRGGKDEESVKNPKLEILRARALQIADENPTAENYHNVGRMYIAEKSFDEAIVNLEKAVKLAPEDAKIHNDLGAAFLEKAKKTDDGKLELTSKANKEFANAINLDKKLLAAYFNKAVSVQMTESSFSAAEAWKEYLNIDSDPTSKWAVEAQRYLKILESQKPQNLSSDTLEKEYFESLKKKDNEEIWNLVSQTRELVTVKYLPQKLAISLLNAPPEERSQRHYALKYLAEIEKQRMQDFFASDMADYYANLSDEQIQLLKQAQNAVIEGYKLCQKEDFNAALESFKSAKDFFQKAGNVIEQNTICDHFIAYCLYNNDKKEEAKVIFDNVDAFCEQKNYKWLRTLNFYWQTGWNSEGSLNKSSTELKHSYEEGLAWAEEMNDSFLIVTYVRALASRSYFFKRRSETLDYIQRLFKVSNQPKFSIRMRFRSYTTAVEILAANDFPELSKSLLTEEIELAKLSEDQSFITHSQVDAGVIYTQTGEPDKAEKWFQEAEKSIDQISNETEKKDLLTRVYIKHAHLERKLENFNEAYELYEKASQILSTIKTPSLMYETGKSKLLLYQAAGKSANFEDQSISTSLAESYRNGISKWLGYQTSERDEKFEEQLNLILGLTEKYRDNISEENDRIGFFDNEQTIYDIATEYNLRIGNTEEAYNYAEHSNSRSLLDWLKRDVTVSTDKKNLEVFFNFNESVNPAPLSEIRERMPAGIQILQYTVLENKILIWLYSKENFVVESSDISSTELRSKIKEYLNSIKNNNPQMQTEGRELYDILISPVLSRLDTNKTICLIPNKALFQVPFAALVSPDEKYFLAQFPLLYSPSANIFLVGTDISKQKSKRADEHLLAVGNPKFDAREYKDLNDLPAAEAEVKTVSKYYENPSVLIYDKADKKSFQELYKNADVIHFAGHYLVNNNSPLLSGLILAQKGTGKEDGILSNFELIGEKLPHTKLVILSACETGFEGFHKSEGFIGLSRTFLSSGVPHVIASQWKVDSSATSVLMQNFHRYRRENNLSTLDALRQAELDMMNQPDSPYQSPYYWASFALLGGYEGS